MIDWYKNYKSWIGFARHGAALEPSREVVHCVDNYVYQQWFELVNLLDTAEGALTAHCRCSFEEVHTIGHTYIYLSCIELFMVAQPQTGLECLCEGSIPGTR